MHMAQRAAEECVNKEMAGKRSGRTVDESESGDEGPEDCPAARGKMKRGSGCNEDEELYSL